MKHLLLSLLFLFSFSLLSGSLSAQAVMLDTAQDHYATVGDVRLHYRVWGKGEPVLLLHGAMEYWREWKAQIPALARNYKVIAVDSRGHGQSSYTDRELSYELMADDMLGLIDKLHIDSINIVGFGDGGMVGMFMVTKQPERFRRLVAIGSNLSPDTTAVYKEVLKKVKAWDIEKMAFYLQVKFKENPNPTLLPQLAKRMQTLLLTQPHISTTDLSHITCPTLIMAGDQDLIKLSHSNYIYEHLPEGYLSIIPASTHYCINDKPAVVNSIILDFLKSPPTRQKRF